MNTELLLQLALIGGPAALAGFTVGVLYGRGSAAKAIDSGYWHWDDPSRDPDDHLDGPSNPPEVRITRLTSRNRSVEL